MKLHDFLAQKNIKMATWGRAVGVSSRSTARRYVVGELFPPREVLERTFLWSGGQVAPNDWCDLPKLPAGLGEAA